MKVVLLPQAQDDLGHIRDPLFSQVVHRLEVLREYPEMGAPMAGPFAGYRSTVIDMYRVIYRLASHDTVEIAYIRDCRRRPPEA